MALAIFIFICILLYVAEGAARQRSQANLPSPGIVQQMQIMTKAKMPKRGIKLRAILGRRGLRNRRS